MSELLNELLIRHEGLRLTPYRDTKGLLTIGVGRNLDEVGLTKDEALLLLSNDLERVRCELDQALPWWNKLGEVREAVLISLGYNLGVLTPPGKAKLLTFSHTLDLIKNARYAEAADRLLTLPWADQVGKEPPSERFPYGQRAYELTEMLRTGRWAGDTH